MPGGNGRWVVVVIGCLCAGPAAGLDRPAAHPGVYTPGSPGPDDDPPVKDLTPPGFGDVRAAANGHGDVPGALRPTATDEPGLFAVVEALILRPRRSDFDYAVHNTTQSLAATGRIDTLNYDLRVGVRTEVGYRFDHSGWDVAAGYTYFRSRAEAADVAGPGQVLYPTLTRPGLTTQVLGAGATAGLEYNVYDLVLGRRFALDEHLAVRAFGGLRFASIRQDFDASYGGLDARTAAVSAASRYQGFGPVAGGEAVFAGWKGFHLYGAGTVGVLTGTSDNPLTETNDGGRTVYTNLAYSVRQVVPVVGVGVGGGWQYRTVSVRAGYEVVNYFNLTQQPRFTDDASPGKFVPRPGNLSLEGVFVRVGLTY